MSRLSDGHRTSLFPFWQLWGIYIIGVRSVKKLIKNIVSVFMKIYTLKHKYFKSTKNPLLNGALSYWESAEPREADLHRLSTQLLHNNQKRTGMDVLLKQTRILLATENICTTFHLFMYEKSPLKNS